MVEKLLYSPDETIENGDKETTIIRSELVCKDTPGKQALLDTSVNSRVQKISTGKKALNSRCRQLATLEERLRNFIRG